MPVLRYWDDTAQVWAYVGIPKGPNIHWGEEPPENPVHNQMWGDESGEGIPISTKVEELTTDVTDTELALKSNGAGGLTFGAVGGGGIPPREIKAAEGGSYTLLPEDAGKIILLMGSEVKIPLAADDFPNGSEFILIAAGPYSVDFWTDPPGADLGRQIWNGTNIIGMNDNSGINGGGSDA